jgi:hypothetical protein
MVSTKSTPSDREMDTKTDTKPGLRICPADRARGVHLGVHSPSDTGVQPHYSIGMRWQIHWALQRHFGAASP